MRSEDLSDWICSFCFKILMTSSDWIYSPHCRAGLFNARWGSRRVKFALGEITAARTMAPNTPKSNARPTTRNRKFNTRKTPVVARNSLWWGTARLSTRQRPMQSTQLSTQLSRSSSHSFKMVQALLYYSYCIKVLDYTINKQSENFIKDKSLG